MTSAVVPERKDSMRLSMMPRTRGRGPIRAMVIGLALTVIASGLATGPARADDDGRRHERFERERFERELFERERHVEERRDREWREHHHEPGYVYAPPTVVYAPPPPPLGIDVVIPLHFH